MQKLNLFLLALLCCFGQICSYKILIVVTPPSKSHYNLGKAIADVLHERGHEITMWASMKNEKPTFREIYIEELMQMKTNKSAVNLTFDLSKQSFLDSLLWVTEIMPKLQHVVFNNKHVHKLLKDKNEKFDLVILESFLNDALMGLAEKYDCPLIALSPVSLMSWLAVNSQNPLAPETTPDIFGHTTAKMTLMQRVQSVVMLTIQEFIGHFILNPKHEDIYKVHLPEEAARVPFSEAKKRLSAVFINSHSSISPVRPLFPNAIEIGGYHVGEAKPLPEDLQKIMDSATDGVIYFSMGSNLNSADMSDEVRDTLLKTFGKLKQKVFWKFEKDLPGRPSNVIIRNWMPQNSILAHKNTKFFITHGGLLSRIEAASFGIPLLAIPIFGDQHHNALSIAESGNGILMDYFNITETSFAWAIKEMLKPKYTQRAKEIQLSFNDRPMRPRDLIAFYAEHVIRTKGARHLSPPRLSRISTLLLDVYAILILTPIILLSILVFTCKKICCGKKTKVDPVKTKASKQKKSN